SDESPSARTNWFDESRLIGVPVAPFPRWLVCSRCRLLAPISSGLFEPKVQPYRPDKTRYVHACGGKVSPGTAVPARFIVACKQGHMDDFPWVDYVHRDRTGCQGPLVLYEVGASGEAADVEVKCEKCNAHRRMAEAFGRENQKNLPSCTGRRPHLRDSAPGGCDEPNVRPMLQGASGAWYGLDVSVLSLPKETDLLGQLVEEHWVTLEKAESEGEVTFARKIGQLKGLSKYSDAKVWAAVVKKREGTTDADEPENPKVPEWLLFSNPQSVPAGSRLLKLRPVDPPDEYTSAFSRIVIADTLREVRALVGFTRIESPKDFDTPSQMPEGRRAPLSRRPPIWVPATETIGEGLFLHFSEDELAKWMGRDAVAKAGVECEDAWLEWRKAKQLPPTAFPSMRYVLLHSFSHALLRELAVECGYTAASLSERIYCSAPGDEEPMAGVLIYTAAPDSEGTLGGLSALGEPARLGRYITQALERAALCSSDPLCAEHHASTDRTLHGGACHACLFLPETCCERGNKFLDRSCLTATVERSDLAFFRA
ncbi:MAG: DUF1998 domain-containing protein, partial [Thermoanaerobaculia bacterium]